MVAPISSVPVPDAATFQPPSRMKYSVPAVIVISTRLVKPPQPAASPLQATWVNEPQLPE